MELLNILFAFKNEINNLYYAKELVIFSGLLHL